MSRPRSCLIPECLTAPRPSSPSPPAREAVVGARHTRNWPSVRGGGGTAASFASGCDSSKGFYRPVRADGCTTAAPRRSERLPFEVVSPITPRVPSLLQAKCPDSGIVFQAPPVLLQPSGSVRNNGTQAREDRPRRVRRRDDVLPLAVG